ncbi:MAG: tetratricopeptide repeat protein [Candidatus Rokuibacteriota bacterium]
MRTPARAGLAVVVAATWVAVSLAAASPAAAGDTAGREAVAARPAASDGEIARWTAHVARRPQDADALVRLGDAYGQKARETADPGYYARAEAAFERARALRPELADALVGLAWVAGARHEFTESAAWARRALAIDAALPAAHGLLGDAALEQGDYTAAAEHYQRMLDLRPDLASLGRAGQVLFVTGNAAKAIVMMQKAVAAGAPYAENTAWARAQLALMLWHTGALLPALVVLSRALADCPHRPHLHAAWGRGAASRGDLAAGIRHLRRAVALAPHVESVAILGDLLAASGEAEDAQRQYALVEVIARLHRAAGVRGGLELAAFHADHATNLEWAVSEAEAVYRERKTVQAADTLAWSYYQSGRYEDARRVIADALRHRTPDARILFHAGMIHWRLSDRHHAQRYLYQALSLNPRFHPRDARLAAATLRELGTAAQ